MRRIIATNKDRLPFICTKKPVKRSRTFMAYSSPFTHLQFRTEWVWVPQPDRHSVTFFPTPLKNCVWKDSRYLCQAESLTNKMPTRGKLWGRISQMGCHGWIWVDIALCCLCQLTHKLCKGEIKVWLQWYLCVCLMHPNRQWFNIVL